MFDHSSNYVPYKEKQIRLVRMLDAASDTIKILNMNQYKENLDALSRKVNDDSFKIQVVGTFKNGKSTFINSFLGSAILPAYATPCTAVINEVKHGNEKKAVLYFKDPMPSQLPSAIPSKTMTYMNKYGLKHVPPIEIPYEEIEDYAVIPIGADPKEMLMESPYEKIELFWPLDLLNNGVEIIDSPGLNEHATRTQVTTEYLNKADAVLFVLSANALCGSVEMKFIKDNLRGQGFEDIYFIVNRFDTLSNSDKERVKQYARMRLSEETSFGEKGIFFVSALDALNGKVNNDQALYDQSGMEAFEHAISVFLVEHKGRIKLSQPARELKRILNEEALFKIIPQQKSMLDSDLDELKERYALAKPKLENLEQKKDQMSKRISKLIEQMMPDIRRCANNYYQDLNANIAAWVNEYEIQTKVSVFRARQSADELVAEITEYLKDKIEEEQGIWLENTLQPLTEDKAKNILDSIEGNLENFFVELDRIKINIAGLESNDIKTIPLWQRIAAAGGGLLIGDIGVAALGGISGFSKDFAKGIALQVGAYIGLSIFGLLNPFTILLVIGASIIKAITGGGKNIEGNVKKAIIEETQKEIEASSFEAVESIMNDVKAKVSDIGDMVVRSMDTDIKEVKIQVDDIIRQMESGQENVDKRKARLAECEEQIKLLSTDLDNFIFQLIG